MITLAKVRTCLEEKGFSIRQFDLRPTGGGEGLDVSLRGEYVAELFFAVDEVQAQAWVDDPDDERPRRVRNVVYQLQANDVDEMPIQTCIATG